MIRTLVWKERREQSLVFPAMLILGFVLNVGLAYVLGPAELRSIYRRVELLGIVATVVAFTYGMVCGAMMLAGEREARTLDFLDYLERSRLRIWTTKAAVGALLTFGLALVKAGEAVVLGPNIPNSIPWFVIVPVLALAGFAWGLLGSALCRNVLAAVGVAAALIFVVSLFWFAFVAVLAGHHDRVIGVSLVGGAILFTLAALAASALIFCRPDWQRAPTGRTVRQTVRRAKGYGLRAVLWLTYQQGRAGFLVLAVASVILGTIIPDHALLLWPLATLLLGVACGLGVFAGEQTGDGQRFLGDQRLPLGRIWITKTICWLVAGGFLAALMFVTALLQFVVLAFRSGEGRESLHLVDRLIGPDWLVRDLLDHIGPWMFLTVGLAYGFAFGEFFGLLTRKTAVAAVLAVLVGFAVAGAWLPSLLAGGVYVWQVLIVPAILLVGLRPVLWPWASGRLHTVRPLVILTGIGVLGLAWIAGNLWFRAVQIPDVGQPFDIKAFAASLPAPDNEAGELIRQAAGSLGQYEQEVNAQFKAADEQKAATPGKGNAPAPQPKEWDILLGDVLQNGWTKDNAAAGPWLDRMFQGKWAEEFRKAVRLPLGMIVNLRLATADSENHAKAKSYMRAANLFTARAYQLMAQGKQEAALEHLEIVLALSRQLRHKALAWPYFAGLRAQIYGLSAMDVWLRDLGPKPALLRSALIRLNQHAAQQPTLESSIKAQYFVVDSNRDNPAVWAGGKHDRNAPEMFLLVAASRAPWEAERETRLLHLLGANALKLAESPLWVPWSNPFLARAGLATYLRSGTSYEELPRTIQWAWSWGLGYNRVEENRQLDGRTLCQLRGTQLITALALFQLEKGQPAASLDALVPAYLPAVPQDPYTGQPFRYRVSRGEKIERGEKMESEPNAPLAELGAEPLGAVNVRAGQGVVWSVGPSGQDYGGTPEASRVFTREAPVSGRNWDFLVPRWAGKGKER
jgi:hypothetical protein